MAKAMVRGIRGVSGLAVHCGRCAGAHHSRAVDGIGRILRRALQFPCFNVSREICLGAQSSPK